MSQLPPNAPPIPPPQAPQKKMGLPPLAWVAIGCGGLLVIAVLIVAAGGFFFFSKAKRFATHPETTIAQMIMAGNPDLEVVTVDDGAGTITVRNKKTGEVLTINLSDAKKGKIVFKGDKGQNMVIETTGEDQAKGITMKSDKGSFTLGEGAGADAKVPSWIPSWPGANIQSTFSGQEEGKRTGMVQFEVDADAARALDFFEAEFKGAGFEVKKSTYDMGAQGSGGTITAKSGPREANVTVNRTEGKTVVAVMYEEKD
jgi:hypothetical protein